MVQNAAVTGSWPSSSPQVRELIRQGAEIALRLRPEWVAEIDSAALASPGMEAIAADPVLAEGIRRNTLANLRHWAAANVQAPGLRVPPNLDPDNLETARDLARRGLDRSALDSYRTGQSRASRRWMTICFELTQDPDLLHELLDVSLLSISTFIDDTIDAVASVIEAERDQLKSGSHAERRAAVSLILERAPLSRARAEAQLGYPLTGPHVAAVVWTAVEASTTELDAAAEALVQASGATRRLTVVASSASHWVWLPVATAPTAHELATRLVGHPGVSIAVGRPGRDIEGFRRSHLDASTTQRMMTRLASPQRIARYQDIQLVALMTTEPASADEYVAEVLGDLATADPETRDVVLAFVQEQFNTSRTARRLHAHRNTVIRRLARADELLPRPLAEHPVDVAAALTVLQWRGGS
ncbi:PucR family transcriptional regulator [Pimelobacter simplex]|uniref:Transcriptional regulator n=1 Tax=Nocardioides simplex TaxID=2045 RepID=A0A0J9YH65_NOCSI|nr:transcriptional regulator [Pimelobacter simplex]MCG8149430.1 PucR family transcriptional regulator [Pimelobacter simplex]